MQAHSKPFARVYNTRWAAFAKQVAPRILEFYESKPVAKTHESVLDLCCGAGHLAVHFLENGYHVVGIDLSEHTLRYAEENASQFVQSGQAKFIQADASDFTWD